MPDPLHIGTSGAASFVLPAAVATQTTAILGIRGSGKTNTAVVLAQSAGYSAGTGHFNNVVGSLRTLGAVDYPHQGFVVASELLFPPILL